jgi:hypothetical protein
MSSDELARLLLARARIWRGERGSKVSEAVAVLPFITRAALSTNSTATIAAVFVVAYFLRLPVALCKSGGGQGM